MPKWKGTTTYIFFTSILVNHCATHPMTLFQEEVQTKNLKFQSFHT